MRIAALLACMAMVGAAQAAPASSADIERLQRALQLDANSALLARLFSKSEPVTEFADAGQQQCFDRQMREFTARVMADSLLKGFATSEGDRMVDEWMSFLQTPSGNLFLAAMNSTSNEAELLEASLPPDELARGEAFISSETGRRLNEAMKLGVEIDMDAALLTFVKNVQVECQVEYTSEQRT